MSSIPRAASRPVIPSVSKANVRPPVIFAAPTDSIKVKVLGTDDAPHLIVNLALAESLSDDELVAAIGHELAHIQNGHILYVTALHYLTHSAAFFVRWAIQPAIMTLQAWSRRAEVTCDRAALIDALYAPSPDPQIISLK